MKLIQLFLPVYDQNGHSFPKAYFDDVRNELTGRFGGVTAFLRSPAVGVWENPEGDVSHDDVYLFEVLTESLERDWWQAYRRCLEQRFCQDQVLVRVSDTEVL